MRGGERDGKFVATARATRATLCDGVAGLVNVGK